MLLFFLFLESKMYSFLLQFLGLLDQTWCSKEVRSKWTIRLKQEYLHNFPPQIFQKYWIGAQQQIWYKYSNYALWSLLVLYTMS